MSVPDRSGAGVVGSGPDWEGVFDALTANVCVLGEDGAILFANKAWREFAEVNGLAGQSAYEGANYLAVCDAVTGPDAASAGAFAAGIRAVMRGERDEFALEYPCHSPEERHWFVGRVTRLAAGGVGRAVVVHEDVTQRVLSENALRVKENVVSASLDGIAMADLDGRLTYANQSFLDLWGYQSSQEVVGMTAAQLLMVPEEAAPALQRLVQNGRWEGEIEGRRKDGTCFTAQVAATLISSGPGEPVSLMGSFRDITDRRRNDSLMQVRLRLREYAESHGVADLLQRTLDEIGALTGSPIGFLHFVEDDQRTVSLQAWSTLTIERFCSAKGKGMRYAIDAAGVWVDCLRERRPVIYNDYASLPHRKGLPEGHAEVVRVLLIPVMRGGRAVAILGVGNKPTDYDQGDADLVHDLADMAYAIADRRQAEESLRQASVIVENSPVVLFRWRAAEGWPVEMVSENVVQFGYTPDELRSGAVPYAAIVHPDDLDRVAREVKEHSASGVSQFQQEYRIVSRDGAARWVDDRTSVGRDAGGRIVFYEGVVIDITKRKLAEEALRESEERFRALVTNQGEGSGIVDADEIFRFANPAANEIFGVAPGGLIGRSVLEFIDPADVPLIRAQSDLRRKGQKSEYELRIRRSSGETRTLLVTATPRFEGETVKGTYGVFRDITERRKVEEANRQHAAQMDALREVSLGITAHLDLDTLLRTITERALTLFGANAGTLYLYQAERDALERAVVLGAGTSGASRELRRGEDFVGRVWRAGKPLYGPKHAVVPEKTAPGRWPRWGSAMGVPIHWGEEFLGVLAVFSLKEGTFTAADAELVELFAAQAAVAIVNARLFAQVESLAQVDELTKLLNRRGLRAVGQREVERSRRFLHPLSMLFVDLDHFKDVNDRFSHEVGDVVLREVGARIVSAVREIDIVSRYGGEEFVVLLLETNLPGAREVAERIRHSIEGAAVATDSGPVPTTVSIGIAPLRPDAPDLDLLLRRADEAMYAAKRAGRNRVVVSGE